MAISEFKCECSRPRILLIYTVMTLVLQFDSQLLRLKRHNSISAVISSYDKRIKKKASYLCTDHLLFRIPVLQVDSTAGVPFKQLYLMFMYGVSFAMIKC